jgi:hypothetical protein
MSPLQQNPMGASNNILYTDHEQQEIKNFGFTYISLGNIALNVLVFSRTSISD